ncbi:DUF4010 domain-containing protein, partial [Rhodovulum sp.]|uniref:DUF4010 domain-containing protein n=1 Tax=Rhodovulum sp. TaxID=34009 RepID=UPI0017E62000
SETNLDGLSNPLALGTALSFGAVLVGVVLATHYLQLWFGAGGVLAVAAASGVTDVDALTITVARMVRDGLGRETAAAAILLAVSVNTVVKGGIAAVLGGGRFGLRVLAVYAVVLATGAAALALG